MTYLRSIQRTVYLLCGTVESLKEWFRLKCRPRPHRTYILDFIELYSKGESLEGFKQGEDLNQIFFLLSAKSCYSSDQSQYHQ